MSAGAQIDYTALAKQAGAIASQPAGVNGPQSGNVDYAALAKQAGATSSEAATPSNGGFDTRTFGGFMASLKAHADEYAGKALAGAGLPTSISNVPEWFQHLTGTHPNSEPFWEPIRQAIQNPTQENIVGAVPFVGPASVAMSKDVQKGNYGGAVATLAGTLAAPKAWGMSAEVAGKLPSMAVSAGQNAIEGASSLKQSAAEEAVGPVVRKTPSQTVQDLKFGRNPVEAITREPGLEGATVPTLRDGVVKRMNEIGQAMDGTLSHPDAMAKSIDVEPIIDKAAANVKASPMAKLNPGLADRIDALTAALKTQFGDLTKNPLEATQMKRDIGDAAKWTGQPFDNEANQFLVQVYRGLKDKVNAEVPEVKPLNERYADLLSAKTALDRRIAFNTNRPLSVGRALLGAGGGAVGTITGGALGGVGGAAAGLGLDLLRSDPARITAGKLLGNKYPFPGK
jgi:hypothetical protein